MAVRLRLMRMGKKKQPTYRVVVADSRSPRDGRFIELIGRYDPRQEPSIVEIDNDRAVDWLQKGAQPSPQVRKLLEISGAWSRFRIAAGDIHTIDEPAPAPEPAATEDMPKEIHVVGGEAPVEAETAPVGAASEAPVEAAPEAPVDTADEVTSEVAETAAEPTAAAEADDVAATGEPVAAAADDEEETS